MFKIPNTSFDRRHSVDSLLHNGVMDNSETVDDRSIVFKPEIGFFAESSTRYISCALTGPISVRLTFASTAVLTPTMTGVAIGAALTDHRHQAIVRLFRIQLCKRTALGIADAHL